MPDTTVQREPTVIGIGASAGGLAALKNFLAHVPPDSGLVFVVVVHLAPDHESHLAEVLQPHVRLSVRQVNQTVLLEPNNVYVIPPNCNLSAIDTHLRLTKLEERRKERAPIDHFFRTLAATHDGNAVAVILTGTGSDGTLGVKDIKAHGGLVIVQDPAEAEYDSMPQSAIGTGLADFILPVSQIPDVILRYDKTQPQVDLPRDGEELPETEEKLLQKVFAQLRARTDRDFSRYKRSTVLRRIARRMQLNYVDDLPRYIDQLNDHPEEVRALAEDLLITVTHFFRDPEVFKLLEAQEIPRLLSQKTSTDQIRLWCVGCATGEEAYSLAILLDEAIGRMESRPRIQVFASDLHVRSLEKAREALYPGDIEADVSAERLRRFFTEEAGGYRVKKELRDVVVFAQHNLLADPPFSRMDLISCRNLLIYLERDVQHDVVDIFHYALNVDGTLVLGSAEALESSDLFRTVDKKLCVFRKRNVPRREPRLPVFPLMRTKTSTDSGRERHDQPMAYGLLHQQMVEQYAPPSILVSSDNRVVHFSEHAGRYMVHPGGEPTDNVLKLVREELRIELQATLQEAREKKRAYDSKPIPVRFNGHARPVVLHIRPALDPGREGLALIIFEEREPSESTEGKRVSKLDGARVKELEAELSTARERLQSIIEEYESSQEEMKASSEEMQSTNEELRSTLEELETSKEELQSVNEELQTVNQQNRYKVEELAQLSSDLQNLLAATDIATLFLDRELRILRFTPKLGELFNVRASDQGRPISDLTHRLGYTDLRTDAGAVLSTLVPVEREVQDESGRWYLTRVLPYRSQEDRIEGIVITFIDIDSRKRAIEALTASEDRLRRMINVDVVGVLIFEEATGDLVGSNSAVRKMLGYSQDEIVARRLNWRSLTAPQYADITEQEIQQLAKTGLAGPFEKEYLCKDGRGAWMIVASSSLGDGTIIEYCIDISGRKQAEEEVRNAQSYAQNIINLMLEPLIVLSPDLKVQLANPAFRRCFNLTPEQVTGRPVYELGNGEWNSPSMRALFEEVLPKSGVAEDIEMQFDGDQRRVMLLNARRMEAQQLVLVGLRDITERKRAEEELRSAEHNLRNANEALVRANADLKHFSYAVSHDMQEPLRMVTSYTQLLARHYHENLDKQAAQYVDYAVQGARRMETLLNALREYWSVDEERADESASVNCNLIFDQAMAYLETAVEESNAVVTHDTLPTVRAEVYPLTLLFQNLISNAIKYRRPDTRPRIHVSAHKNGQYWNFAVSDNGIGIESEYLEAIFAPFKRLNGREYAGTGLGLATCKRIVERYHGRIWVESTLGSGSTFRFTLPEADR